MAALMRKLMNMIMKPLLRSPLHAIASGWCMLVTFTGRKTGRTYTTPVYYRRDGDVVRFFSGRNLHWVQNFKGGAPVVLRLRGADVLALATLLGDPAENAQHLREFYPRMSAEQAAGLVLVEARLANGMPDPESP